MSLEDRRRWDQRYAAVSSASVDSVAVPARFAAYEALFPTTGLALDLACGRGLATVWLARRGLRAWGFDVSPVAVGQARDLAQHCGVGDHCRFDVVDLDDGLPDGPLVDVVHCHRFRDRRLDGSIVGRLAAGGLLAISALSEVGAGRGPFRAVRGELPAAFAELDIVAAGEGDGEAWLLGRRR